MAQVGRRYAALEDWRLADRQPACLPGTELTPRFAAIEDVHPQCGRELCALARVNMIGSREPGRSSGDDLPAPWSPAHPPAAQGSCKWPPGAACVDRRRSASRLGV